jgi:hypothetical protein
MLPALLASCCLSSPLQAVHGLLYNCLTTLTSGILSFCYFVCSTNKTKPCQVHDLKDKDYPKEDKEEKYFV